MSPVKKTWKSVERRIAKAFGGRRVPLSGMNSGHTSADVMPDPNRPGAYPDFLYVEIKRDKLLNERIKPYVKNLRNGFRFYYYEGGADYYLYYSDYLFTEYTEDVGTIDALEDFHPLWKINADSWVKSIKEKKSARFLICQIHNTSGFYIFADVGSINQYKTWLKSHRHLLGL